METLYTESHYYIDYRFGDTLNIVPFGDIHRDTLSCDVDRWKWFLLNAKKLDQEKTHYICLGDVNDFASAKEQSILKKSDLHKQTMDKLDMIVMKDNRAVAKEMSFMRDRFIGMVDGNHNWVFTDGKTAAEDLAERLNAPYLGWLSHITVHLNMLTAGGKNHGHSFNVYIVACHGKAGGKLAGSSINQVEDLKKIFPIADIYIMGHDHQRGAWPTSILIPGDQGCGLKQKRQFLARSGSFKKGYSDGEASYEVSRLYRPSDMGVVQFSLSLHRQREKGGHERIITDIKAII